MQVVEGGDGSSEVALSMVQLFYIPRNLLDLRRKRNKVEGLVKKQTQRKRKHSGRKKEVNVQGHRESKKKDTPNE